MYNEKFLHRAWAEVDLKQIVENVKIYLNSREGKTKLIAVVKADAYGHGDVKVAEALQKIGIDFFAVSNVHEAVTLRNGGIKGEILVLGYTPVESVELLSKYDITQTLISYDYAVMLHNYSSKRIKCHIAVDTGMNRIGFSASEYDTCIKEINDCCEKFNVEGLFTHLSVADSISEEDRCFTEKQIGKFKRIVDETRQLNFKYIHCLNSAAGLSYPNSNEEIFNVVRLGIVMYGLKPDYGFSLHLGIKPALTWKTVVSMIKEVQSGESIGYGISYVAKKQMRVATLPVGYADGYNRQLSNKGYVLIRGKKACIVGKICMDQMMVDVSDIDGLSIGDEVILIGKSGDKEILADEMAHLIDTIGYEIVCGISKRVPRIYLHK